MSRCSSTQRAAQRRQRQNQYQTLGLLMYEQGWTNDQLGRASAIAWTMFLIILVAVLVNAADRSPPSSDAGRPITTLTRRRRRRAPRVQPPMSSAAAAGRR